MVEYEEPDVIMVSSKGQVVIPKAIRKKLGIGPRTKLLVYDYQGAIVMKKIEVSNLIKGLEEICKRVDMKIAKHGEISEEEIDEIVQEYRRQKSK